MEKFDRLLLELGELSATFKEGFTELSKNDNNKQTLDIISQAFSKIEKTIYKINKVDITPLASVLSDISKQNNSILDTIGRLIHSANNKDIITLITETAKQSNEMVAAVLEKTNSEDFKVIAQAINDGRATEILIERDTNGFIKRGIIHYKKQ